MRPRPPPARGHQQKAAESRASRVGPANAHGMARATTSATANARDNARAAPAKRRTPGRLRVPMAMSDGQTAAYRAGRTKARGSIVDPGRVRVVLRAAQDSRGGFKGAREHPDRAIRRAAPAALTTRAAPGEGG